MSRKAISDAKVQLRSWKLVVGFDIENVPLWKAVHVKRVQPGQSPDLMGLLVGDLVTHVDGAPVHDKVSFRKIVSRKRPGDLVCMRIHRTNETRTLFVQMGAQGVGVDFVQRVKRIADGVRLTHEAVQSAREALASMQLWLGCDFQEADGACTKLCRVFPGQPADVAGLEVNDCVETVQGAPTRNMEEFRQQISTHQPGDVLAFLIRRGGRRHTVHVHLGAKGCTLVEVLKLRQLVADGEFLTTPSKDQLSPSSGPPAEGNGSAAPAADTKRGRSGLDWSGLFGCRGCSRARSGSGVNADDQVKARQLQEKSTSLQQLERQRKDRQAEIQREQQQQSRREQLERQLQVSENEHIAQTQVQGEKTARVGAGAYDPDPTCPQYRIPEQYCCPTEVTVTCSDLVLPQGAYSVVSVHQGDRNGDFLVIGHTKKVQHSSLARYGEPGVVLEPVRNLPLGGSTPFKLAVCSGSGPSADTPAEEHAYTVLTMNQLYGALKAPLAVALRDSRSGEQHGVAGLVVSAKMCDAEDVRRHSIGNPGIHDRQAIHRHSCRDVADTHLAREAQAKLDDLIFDFGADWVEGSDGCCYIDNVVPIGPADVAGLMDGDQIKSINGEPTPDMLAVRWQCIQNRPGDTLKMVLTRDSEILTVFVTIGAVDLCAEDVGTLLQVARGERLQWPETVSPRAWPVRQQQSLLSTSSQTRERGLSPRSTLSYQSRGMAHGGGTVTSVKMLQEKSQHLERKLVRELGCKRDYDATKRGVQLFEILPTRAAGRAGLIEGDVITAIAGVPTPDVHEFDEQFKLLQCGQVIEFSVSRRGAASTPVVVVVGAKGFTIEQVAAIKRVAAGDIVDADLLRPPWFINQD